MQGKVLRVGDFDQGFLIGCGTREALPGKVRFKLTRTNSTGGGGMLKALYFRERKGKYKGPGVTAGICWYIWEKNSLAKQ